MFRQQSVGAARPQGRNRFDKIQWSEEKWVLPVAGFIPEGTITRILESTDIVELVGRYFPLKRAGQGFVALCPFHNEKTPSFHVTPQRQIFHCFGCGKGGDAIRFVMEMEKVPFPEAAEILAERCGIQLERGATGSSAEKRKNLYDVVRWAARQFVGNLASPAGKIAGDYLERRGISAESIRAFHLGYAMPGWDDIARKAPSDGISRQSLEATGLIVTKNDSYYDRFRNRVIFPIISPQEKVVGFGARTLDPNENAKYINSPETALFSKGKLLYGLNLAKNEIIRTGTVVVVEGYTDVIMAHQHGITNVVATLGTALGREHIRQLKRYARKCTLVYDADIAGQKASDSSLQAFVEEEMELDVATLPEGKDPCDCLIELGPEVFRQRLDAACGIYDYKLRAVKAYEQNDPKRAAAIIDEVLDLIARIPNVVERRIRFDRVAVMLGHRLNAEESTIRQRLIEKITKAARTARPGRQPSAAPGESARPELPSVERELLTVSLQQPELFAQLAGEVRPEDFSHDGLRAIFRTAWELFDENGSLQPSALSARLAESELASLLAQLVSDTQGSPDLKGRLESCLPAFRQHKARKRISELNQLMLTAAQKGDAENFKRLEHEYLGYLNRGGIDGQV